MIAQKLVNTDHTLSSTLKNSQSTKVIYMTVSVTEKLWTMFSEELLVCCNLDWVFDIWVLPSKILEYEGTMGYIVRGPLTWPCRILWIAFDTQKSLNTVTLSCIIGNTISIVRYEESPSWTSPNERVHAPIQFSLVLSPPAARPRSGAALVWPGTELLASSGFSV